MHERKRIGWIGCVAVGMLIGVSTADAQTVRVTPLGASVGNLSTLDRALLFEDPTGVRILYDPGFTVSATDPRLGDVHAILISHGHGDHVGSTAAIAAAKNAAVITAPNLANFLGKKIEAIRGAATAPCGPTPPFGGGTNALTVPLAAPCTGLLGVSASRVLTIGGAGVEVISVPANHDSSAASGSITTSLSGYLATDALTGYHDPANGFILKFTNGLVVYLTGDTGLTGEMDTVIRRYYKPSLMVINIGDVFTTGPEAAAFAVTDLVQPKSVIPSHANEAATSGGVVVAGSRTARFKAAVEGTTPPGGSCLSPRPGADWVCVGSGWLPPNHHSAVPVSSGTRVHVPLSETSMNFNGSGTCVSGCS